MAAAPAPQDTGQGTSRAGLSYGFGAYGIWGLVPLFWPLLKPAGAGEILAHRMVWSLGVVAILLLCVRRWAWAAELARDPRRLALVAVAAAVITVNWGVYIWAVNAGHVVEASLGYFINPLVSIALGVLLLGERLRPVQWVAVATGVASVLVLAIGYGKPPWISLALAFSFGAYGLAKKKVNLGGIESLAAETALQFLPALGFLLWLGARGGSTFTGEGTGHAALLASTGIVTAVPLVFFGAAAIRVPLSTLGLLQYLAPVFQFALGIFYFHEEMPPARWAGFGLVWIALLLLTWDALRTARANRRTAERLRRAVREAEAAGDPAGAETRAADPVAGETPPCEGTEPPARKAADATARDAARAPAREA
ncbi:EamA family transporter RarD [Streptomyces sp. SPB074]|uniref:EamA family transporter RarD n=1 Tax=Streptomyces sp. (strain SPB074) TaxID=465543 RepID=UPI00017F1CF1|nr:EamA family transporter RarD [Streptomyces sp. SPB074]EDY44129.1 integral membrane protein [Streptomyces sp. SPB074]